MKIVVHCSDSPHRGDTAKDVHRWHLQRGWGGIGYHYTINEDGVVEAGRPHYWDGAHVRGYNVGSLGIMLFGKMDFTEVQMEKLEELIRGLLTIYPSAEVCGHRDLDKNKTCPNFDVKHWWEEKYG